MAKKRKKIPMWKLLGLPGPLRVYRNRPRLYTIWEKIRVRSGVRCPKSFRRDRHYKYYAHVTMCKKWLVFKEFYFWAKSHGYSDDLTIDRKDGSKGYTPDNCRWATRSEQNKNRHYTKAFYEACRRNVAIARAALWAKRRAHGSKIGNG